MAKYNTVTQYFNAFPKEIQVQMEIVREAILASAPDAEEVITYNMPGFRYHQQYLVAYAAYKHHIGFYPGSEAIEVFAEDIERYQSSKGAIRFPLTQKIPVALIRKIVKYRIKHL